MPAERSTRPFHVNTGDGRLVLEISIQTLSVCVTRDTVEIRSMERECTSMYLGMHAGNLHVAVVTRRIGDGDR